MIPKANRQKQQIKDMIFTVFKGFSANLSSPRSSKSASPPSRFFIGRALKIKSEKLISEQFKKILFLKKWKNNAKRKQAAKLNAQPDIKTIKLRFALKGSCDFSI